MCSARKKRPATALGGLGENSLSRLSLNSLGSQEKGSLRSLSSVWEDGEVFRDVTLRGGFSGGHGDDRDNYGLRQVTMPGNCMFQSALLLFQNSAALPLKDRLAHKRELYSSKRF